MGNCNRSTGKCFCRDGFEGHSCERMACIKSCNNHGTCYSMREAAAIQDNLNLFYATTYTKWDADKIFGCVCDYGWTGYDCSLRTCPSGDDPLTTGQVTEIQVMSCTCATTCSGTFSLTFRGETTAPIPHDTTPAVLEAFLEDLSTISDVTVTSSSATVCTNGGSTTSITFNSNHGNLPEIEIDKDLLTSR